MIDFLDPFTARFVVGVCILVVTAIFAAACAWRP
jgi:hypothetical protein